MANYSFLACSSLCYIAYLSQLSVCSSVYIRLLYNCRMIFFILSFFVGYILSFDLVRLRTIRLSARACAHIECRCSRSDAGDVTITNVIIKTPDRKSDWGMDDVMSGSGGLGISMIFEKVVS